MHNIIYDKYSYTEDQDLQILSPKGLWPGSKHLEQWFSQRGNFAHTGEHLAKSEDIFNHSLIGEV